MTKLDVGERRGLETRRYARINASTRMASLPCVILVPLRLPRKCEFKERIRPINLAINKKKKPPFNVSFFRATFAIHVSNKSRGKIKEGRKERKKEKKEGRGERISSNRLFNASSRENRPSNNFISSFLFLSPSLFPLFSSIFHPRTSECNFCSIFVPRP